MLLFLIIDDIGQLIVEEKTKEIQLSFTYFIIESIITVEPEDKKLIIETVMSMGFDWTQAKRALEATVLLFI